MQTNNVVKLKSNCYCKSEERLTISQDADKYYFSLKLNEKYATEIIHEMSLNEFHSLHLECHDFFSMFRRFKHQKIISLIINNEINNDFSLESFMKQVKHFYPDWLVRIYYRDETNLFQFADRCYFKCLLNNDNNEFYDNIDFCLINESRTFIGISDSFVDYIMFRSLNSINNYEAESV